MKFIEYNYPKALFTIKFINIIIEIIMSTSIFTYIYIKQKIQYFMDIKTMNNDYTKLNSSKRKPHTKLASIS